MENPFIFLRFESKVELFLTNLANQIASNSSPDFYSQHDVRSGLKYYRPFHIKLLSNIKVEHSKQLLKDLQNFGSNFSSVQGQILPLCNISSSGLVSLKISCADCLLINKYLSKLNNDVSFHQDDIVVSIGVFIGSHQSAFQIWLNNELASNRSLFPIFKSDTIELSEEFNNLNIPYFPIKLIGKTHRKSVVPLVESDSPDKNKILSQINLNDINLNENNLDNNHIFSLKSRTICPTSNIKDNLFNNNNNSNNNDVDNNKSINSQSNSQIIMNPNSNQIKKKQFNNNKNNKKNNISNIGNIGNWTCPNCKLEIISKRNSCFKCNTNKPFNYGETKKKSPRLAPVKFLKIHGDVRKGDWTCTGCNGHNFSNKLACFTCHKVKPGYEEGFPDIIDNDDFINSGNKESYNLVETTSIKLKSTIKIMPGDWQCLKCKEIVFAKRNRCYKCSTPKP
jgi:hypothetical protein